jgi:hypothetical protein
VAERHVGGGSREEESFAFCMARGLGADKYPAPQTRSMSALLQTRPKFGQGLLQNGRVVVGDGLSVMEAPWIPVFVGRKAPFF